MKVVIASSAKLQNEIKKWHQHFESKNFEVINAPKLIEPVLFLEVYPKHHIEFFQNITKCSLFFLLNETKNNIRGYIGAECFSELGFAINQNLLYNKGIKIYLLQMPSPEVSCYDEIELYLKLGWIEIYSEKC